MGWLNLPAPKQPEPPVAFKTSPYEAELVLPHSGRFVTMRRPQVMDILLSLNAEKNWTLPYIATRCCLIDNEVQTLTSIAELDWADWAAIRDWFDIAVAKGQKK